MRKYVYVFCMLLSVLLPMEVIHADNGHTTRTATLDLSMEASSVKNEAEGWEWTANADGSYTLLLQDVTIAITGDDAGIKLPRDKNVTMILKGQNTITTSGTGITENYKNLGPGLYCTKTIQGEGSLLVHADNGINLDRLQIESGTMKIYANNALLGGLTTNESYIQNGGNVYINSINADGMYLIGEMQLHGGSLRIEAKTGIGIYTDDASKVYNAITVDGGSLYIDADRGIYRDKNEGIAADVSLSNAAIDMKCNRAAISNKEGSIVISNLLSWNVTASKLFDGSYQLVADGADYQALDSLLQDIAKLNADTYTAASWDALQKSIQSIDRSLYFYEQAAVDTKKAEIQGNRDALVYLPADFSSIRKALNRVPTAIENYTDASRSKLYALVSAIPWDKNITEQSDVEAYAGLLNAAIDSLERKPIAKEEQPKLLQGHKQKLQPGMGAYFITAGGKNFIGIQIDGKVPAKQAYDFLQNSTLYLKPEYSAQLSTGIHALTIAFENGSLQTEFTVMDRNSSDKLPFVEEPKNPSLQKTKKHDSAPDTGNSVNMNALYVTLLLSAIGMTAALKYRNRSNGK